MGGRGLAAAGEPNRRVVTELPRPVLSASVSIARDEFLRIVGIVANHFRVPFDLLTARETIRSRVHATRLKLRRGDFGRGWAAVIASVNVYSDRFSLNGGRFNRRSSGPFCVALLCLLVCGVSHGEQSIAQGRFTTYEDLLGFLGGLQERQLLPTQLPAKFATGTTLKTIDLKVREATVSSPSGERTSRLCPAGETVIRIEADGPKPVRCIGQVGPVAGHPLVTISEVNSFACAPDDDALIVGTAGADRITCASGDNVYLSLEGEDTIEDSWGNDILVGGSGDDTIDAGSGSDIIVMDQGWGHDVLDKTCELASVLAVRRKTEWQWKFANFIVFTPEITAPDLEWAENVLRSRTTGDSIEFKGERCFNFVFADGSSEEQIADGPLPPFEWGWDLATLPKRAAPQDYRIVPGVGVGPILIGMAEHDLLDLMGAPDKRLVAPDRSKYRFDYRNVTVYLASSTRTVSSIVPNSTRVSVAGLAHKGMTEEALVAALGPAQKRRDGGEAGGWSLLCFDAGLMVSTRRSAVEAIEVVASGTCEAAMDPRGSE